MPGNENGGGGAVGGYVLGGPNVGAVRCDSTALVDVSKCPSCAVVPRFVTECSVTPRTYVFSPTSTTATDALDDNVCLATIRILTS